MSQVNNVFLAGLAASIGAVAGAQEGYTVVQSPPTNEATHAEILAGALGGTFNENGLGLSNGTISAVRNIDSAAFENNDQNWAPGTYNAKIVAHESAGRSLFGFATGSDGGEGDGGFLDFHALLNTSDIGSSVTVQIPEQFRWALQLGNSTNGHVYTSRESDNNGLDVMVSYTIRNEADKVIGMALFFEDRIIGSDRDFNDVAVLLTLAPTPQSALLGMLGLGGLGAAAGRRRRPIT
ncbi:MAG TPA: hypothetical protein ENJ00_07405 [Phycisphaerales bacterium]|nr:hypothetical protein [Phycisphaerales bacterium]